MEPPPPPPLLVLPKHNDLSPHLLGFLDGHFKTLEDADNASNLFTSLNNRCIELDADLLLLQRNLTKRSVSWISRSFAAKTTIQNLNFKLENLSLYTSPYGIGSNKIHQILIELPLLAKQMQRIENIHKYIDTTMKLEALVGDLEDAVFASKLSSSSITTDFGLKKEMFHQAIKALSGIELVLVDVAKFLPQWKHLLQCVDIRVDKSLAVLRPQVFADHRVLLASIGWPPKLLTSELGSGDVSRIPNPLVLMRGNQRECYCQSFLGLCTLQHLQIQRENRQLNRLGEECDVGLRAIDELVSPIASRIEYHFLKWVEQPEFIFTLMHKIIRDLIVGVDDVLGPLIDKARLRSYSAREAWVSAMVQILSDFLAKTVFPALAERYKEKHERSEVMSSWLYLMDLIIAFDKQMQSLLNSETFLFTGDSEMVEGLTRGISVLRIFVGRPDWLNIWAKIEVKVAWAKLKPELKDEKSWCVDDKRGADFHIGKESELFLLSTREDYKSPVIAESAIKIAWGMIERCHTFPTILLRIRFIRSTAARFLWYFMNALLFRCRKTELSPYSFDDDTLMTICGSINAARYVVSKLREWSDNVNFLEMAAAENDSNIGGRKDDGTDNSCFFGEEIKSLLELETNWLLEIIAVLLRQFETLSWEYVQNKDCFEQEQEDFVPNNVSVARDLAASVDIVEALDALRTQLHAYKKSLNPKDFFDLWRSVAEGVDRFIFCSICTSNIQFSKKGINQFEADVKALFLVFHPFCARPEAFFPCIRETLKLLKLSKEEVKHLQVVLCNDRNRIVYLHSIGISHLSFDQVDQILRNRASRARF